MIKEILDKYIKSSDDKTATMDVPWGGIDMSYMNYAHRTTLKPTDSLGAWLNMYADNGLLSKDFAAWVHANVSRTERRMSVAKFEIICAMFDRVSQYMDFDSLRDLSKVKTYTVYDNATPKTECECRAGSDGIGCIDGVYWLPGYTYGLTCARCKGKGYMSEADQVAHVVWLTNENRRTSIEALIVSGQRAERGSMMQSMVNTIMEIYRDGGLEALDVINMDGEPLSKGEPSALERLEHEQAMQDISSGLVWDDDWEE